MFAKLFDTNAETIYQWGATFKEFWGGVLSWLWDKMSAVGSKIADFFKGLWKTIMAPWRAAIDWFTGTSFYKTLFTSEGAKNIGKRGARPTTAGPGIGAGRGGVVASTSNNVNVEVKAAAGMDERRLAGEVARQVGSEMKKQNRAAMRSLVPVAAR